MSGAEADDDIRALGAELLANAELIGLLQVDLATWFQGGEDLDDAAIDALIAEREQARTDRDFARADEIRDQLAAMGVVLEDGAGGTRWRRG